MGESSVQNQSISESIKGQPEYSNETYYRADDYIKRLQLVKSIGRIFLYNDNSNSKDNYRYQIVIKKASSSGGYTIFSTNNQRESERILIRLSAIFEQIERFITFKTKRKLIS